MTKTDKKQTYSISDIFFIAFLSAIISVAMITVFGAVISFFSDKNDTIPVASMITDSNGNITIKESSISRDALGIVENIDFKNDAWHIGSFEK